MANDVVSYPLIIAEGLDVGLYASIEEAELDLEGVDVEDGNYVGFDAVGRALNFCASGVRRGSILVDVGAAHVTVAESVPGHARELVFLLREYLQEIGQGIDSSNLEVLVAACKRAQNYEA